MKNIIFFDIDGTLRDEVLGVPDSARRAVDELRKKGILVCICTGRTKATLPSDILDITVDYLIAGGGNYIEKNGSVLKQSYFPQDDVMELYHILRRCEATGVIMDGEHTLFMNKAAVNILRNDGKEKQRQSAEHKNSSASKNFGITYHNNFEEYLVKQEGISKFCLWADEGTMGLVKKSKLWQGSRLAQWEAIQDGNGYYEIIQKGCSKGEAVTELCSMLNIDKSHRLAFGDGMNDVDLFKEVGTAVAMESGKRELFPYAAAVCEAPMKDGIYKELKRRAVI